MADYLGGMSLADLEALIRRLVEQGTEGRKVDFKREFELGKGKHAELATDVSSIANTDDLAHHDDFGYIILGAAKGSIVGGVAPLDGNLDHIQAQISVIIRGYVAPVPSFSVQRFSDPERGTWGVIVIPPSPDQPHILIRDGGDDVVKHEWWVRVNDRKERAGIGDYARVMSKATARAIRPLEREHQRTILRLEALEGLVTGFGLQHGSAAVPVAGNLSAQAPSVIPFAASRLGSVADLVRATLSDGIDILRNALLEEALRLSGVMDAEHPDLPWMMGSHAKEQAAKALGFLEESTRPLAEAIAACVGSREVERVEDAVVKAFQVVGREPLPEGGSWTSAMPKLRVYPLVLCLHVLAVTAATEGRGRLLRRVMNLRLDTERGRLDLPMATALQVLHGASDYFKVVEGDNWVLPVSKRLLDVVPGWCSPFVVGASPRGAFFVGEFALALAFLETRIGEPERATPFPGMYLYFPEATGHISRLLRARPPWLEVLFPGKVGDMLAAFDKYSEHAVRSRGFADGFTRGALDAWTGKPPQ